MTSVFSSPSDLSLAASPEELRSMLLERPGKNSKITNPYLLESEACQKCYSQRSLPFSHSRLTDLKTEAKFTESTMIYRLNTTYQIKQIQFTQDAFRGNQVIKDIQVYINNK